MSQLILVLNPGSTSTKISIFEGMHEIVSVDLAHDAKMLRSCGGLLDQLPLRRQSVETFLAQNGHAITDFSAVACRGGTFGTVQGGAYLVDEKLVDACRHPKTNHPSNLAAIIGYELASPFGIPSYIYDAVCTDETEPLAKLSGLKGLNRKPNSHVLNTRAVCRKYAASAGKTYEEMRFICAHIGGGISLNAHRCGRIVDVISDDEGPMSPERAGRLNTLKLVKLCYSGTYDEAGITKLLKGQGGLVSHLGTSSALEVEQRIQTGDPVAAEVYDTMAYQIAKGIGELATVLEGQVDAILLTGGVARSLYLTDRIVQRVKFIAPVHVEPGAQEMEALAAGVLRILQGNETAKRF